MDSDDLSTEQAAQMQKSLFRLGELLKPRCEAHGAHRLFRRMIPFQISEARP